MRPLDDIIADIDKSPFTAFEADEDSVGSGDTRQFIKFMLDDLVMAAPIADTLEIGRHPIITALPNLPGWILGISNVRGEIVSMVDLKAFFNIAPPAVKRDARFIILHNPLFKVGITVDRILGIFTYSRTGVDGPALFQPESRPQKKAGWAEYVSDVIPLKDGVLNILDIKRLLASPQMNAFSSQ
jgi:purine-binding chemotaxis protein CheW